MRGATVKINDSALPLVLEARIGRGFPMSNTKLTALAERLRALKDRKEIINEELKAIDGELTTLTTVDLIEAMDAADITKFTVEGVGSIYQQVKVYASVLKENEAKFHEWLREQGHADLIRDYVFPGTLSSFAKEQIEAGVDLPDFVKATKVPTAMLRRK